MTVEHEEHSANKVMMLYTTINQSAHLAEILTIERSASLDKNKDAVGLSNEQDDSFRQGLLKRYATLPNPILLATVGKFKQAALRLVRKSAEKAFNTRSVDAVQKASISAVVTVPISMTVLITQVRIPIVTDWPGIDLQEHPGFVNAEFIDRPVHTSKRNERVILYFHGGAYALCSPRTHRHVTSNLAKSAQARVLSVDYRLAPKHVYPAALIDALSSYRYLLNKRFQPEQVSFAGDSSGGGLATALMLFLRDTSVMPLPGCVALISPWLDLTQSLPAWHLNSPYDILPHRALDPAHFTEERCNLYTSHDRELTDHYVSPIFSRESEVPLCPVLIHVGEAERPRDDSILFATQRFPNANIDVELYEDQPHVFQAMVGIHAIAKVALQRMGVWIQQRTGKSVEIHKQQQKRHVRVSNKNGYPVTEIKHLGRMLDDGCDALVQLGIWQHDADRLFLLEY